MAAPAFMQPDDPSLADGARARLQKLPKSRAAPDDSSRLPDDNKGKALDHLQDTSDTPVLVGFKDTRKHNDDNRVHDLFKWAIIYENQRGLTLFSTPYYSSRSLLPHDPRPFTVPDPGPSSPTPHPHKTPPNVSPVTYTLPDPTWRWVSRAWLVDMRGDGDVQHDGFEYNWFFRRAHWRPHVGWFSAGGFVRRRRWVRLMMRPSDARRHAEAAFDDRTRADAARPVETVKEPRASVWRGDADDWTRVHAALKAHTRDGPRLELWADWLADLGRAPMRTHPRAWTEDGVDPEVPQKPEPDTDSEVHEHPSREWVLAVLRSHAMDVLGLFIYPDSRAQLRDMFLRAGLAQDIFIGTPVSSRTQFLGPGDFWSRTSELDLLAEISKNTDSTQDVLPV